MVSYSNLITSGLGTLRPLWTSIFSDEIKKNTFYKINIFYGQYLNYTTLEQ